MSINAKMTSEKHRCRMFQNISEGALPASVETVEIGFMIRQNVYRKRPHWATDRVIPVIPTRVPIEIVREGPQTVGPDHARDTCVDGTVRVCDVLTLQSAEVEAWGKIIFMDASRAHCQADATSVMAIELSNVHTTDKRRECIHSVTAPRQRDGAPFAFE